MSTQDQVITILAEQAMIEPEDVTLGVVECIFAIEETFDINVPFNANSPSESDFDISTVRSIVAGVERLKAEQS